MFHSIRWRLVASYVLLTVITVILVGVAALEIVRRYVYQLELDDLQANARVVAQQAAPLYWPEFRSLEMSRLALNVSFLGNVRVRFLDAQQRAIVDSGMPGEDSALLVVDPPLSEEIFPYGPGGMLVVPPDEDLPASKVEQWLSEEYPAGTTVTIIRRSPGGWGSRLTFEEHWLPKTEPGFQAATEPEPASGSESSVMEPVELAGLTVGYIELSSGPDYGAQALAATRQALLIAGSGAVLLAFVLGMFISRRLSAPLVKLSDVAGEMGAGNLSVRAEVFTRDETGELAHRFNQMAERLQASFAELSAERDALRRFISDASHELRTPITALKNFITLLQGPAAEDHLVQAEFLSESQAQINRLEWITQNLLDLSRLDAGLAPLDLAPVEVSDLLEAAAAPFRLPAAEKSIALQVRLPHEHLTMQCDRRRMEMALTNLLDNALKFTPPVGQIELGAEATGIGTAGDEAVGSGVRLWVQDSGPGISSDDLPHIFERFYTGRGQPQAGSGLGLSIAQRIVQEHGGQVHVESVPGQGSRFTIELS